MIKSTSLCVMKTKSCHFPHEICWLYIQQSDFKTNYKLHDIFYLNRKQKALLIFFRLF